MTGPRARLFLTAIALSLATAWTIAAPQAPLAQELREAKTIFLHSTDGLERKYVDRVAKELSNWKRLSMVDDIRKADVVLGLDRSEDSLFIMVVGRSGKELWQDNRRIGITTDVAAQLALRFRRQLDKAK